MRLSNDWREFLESLNSRGIDYVVVGAHSLAFHVTRVTREIWTYWFEPRAKMQPSLSIFCINSVSRMPGSRNLISLNPTN